MSNITQMDLIKADIEYGAKGTGNKEITKNILNQWRGSQKIKDMMEADLYYKVQNTAIDSKTRSYKDNEGHLVINDTLSNIKSKTAKYRKQVRQKTNFAMNKPFIIKCDDKKYKEAWNEFLDEDIREVINRTGKQAINKGVAWGYPWIDENGDLKLIDTISETMYPAWSDTAHTKLDAMVRDYIVTEYNNMIPVDKRFVEFWDSKIFQKFIDYSQGEGAGDLVDINVDTEEDSELSERTSVLTTHMIGSNGEGISWDRVPFIPFKGVDDELPALNECRSDVDNYDLVKSKGLDSVLDDIDAVLVVEDISPELDELTKARQIVQNSRIIAVEQGGSAHFEKVDANIEAIRDELDLIKKDIINDTNTVDLTSIEFSSNPSGKAMRMFFEPLNEWANGFEKEFRVFMKGLKYFFDMWLSWKGGYGTFEELQKKKIQFTLDRDLVVDEGEIITNINTSKEDLSQRTRLELNPYVEDVEQELERLEEDKEKAQEEMELFQFEQTTNNEDVKNVDNFMENNKEKEDKQA